MNVSNLANLFHQNGILQQSKPLGQPLCQPAASDTLHRLSENLLTAREQGQDLKKRFDTLELSAEAADSRADAALSEMPDELLELYLNQYKVAGNLSQQNEASLMEYRDQLSAFDRTIQEYQDMLDGKAEVPGRMSREDVSTLLDRTRAAREQFLQEGAKELNRVGREGPDLTGKARQTVLGDLDDGRDLRWSIDASAKDIYGEIDRALAAAHKTTSMCREGASRIAAELKRRGQADQPYHQLRFDGQDGAAEQASMFRDIYGEIWNTLRNGYGQTQQKP